MRIKWVRGSFTAQKILCVNITYRRRGTCSTAATNIRRCVARSTTLWLNWLKQTKIKNKGKYQAFCSHKHITLACLAETNKNKNKDKYQALCSHKHTTLARLAETNKNKDKYQALFNQKNITLAHVTEKKTKIKTNIRRCLARNTSLWLAWLKQIKTRTKFIQ